MLFPGQYLKSKKYPELHTTIASDMEGGVGGGYSTLNPLSWLLKPFGCLLYASLSYHRSKAYLCWNSFSFIPEICPGNSDGHPELMQVIAGSGSDAFVSQN